jgi:hypothetical protein
MAAAYGVAVVFAIACAGGAAPDAAPVDCRVDADCVPATCCHATACTPRRAAPDCAGVACTMECRPGTLDCGGGCECRQDRCVARPADAPAGADSLPAR